MKAAGLNKEKLGNLDIHLFRSRRNLESPTHRTCRRRQRTKTFVLKFFTRSELWLLTNHAGPLHFLRAPMTIRDDPMTGEKLNRLFTLVPNANVIAEEKLTVRRVTLLRNEEALNLHLNAIGRRGFKRGFDYVRLRIHEGVNRQIFLESQGGGRLIVSLKMRLARSARPNTG